MNLEKHIGGAAILGIGAGISLLGGLFGNNASKKQEDIVALTESLREDQTKLYTDAVGDIDNRFQGILSRFNANLADYKQNLAAQYPDRVGEIQKIFSEENPTVKRYMNNLRKGYDDATKRVYGSIKRANRDEVSNWIRQGVSGGSISRQIAGNQMARLEEGEKILTERFNQVLAPQSQIAQQGMQALGQAEQQQALAQQQAGQLGVTVPTQIGTQQAGAIAGLTGQNIQTQGQIGSLPIQSRAGAQDQQGGLSKLLTGAGSKVVGTGIEKLLAP